MNRIRRPLMAVRPLASEARQAARLGFRMMMRVDREERVVIIRLKSETDKARQACRVASGTSEHDSVEASATYSIVTNDFWDVAKACADAALERVRDALV